VHLLAVHADHLAPAVDALLAEQAGLGGESAAASAHPALPAVLVGEDGQTRLTPEVLHRAVGRALWERDAAYAGCAPGAGMQTVRGFWLRGPGVCVWNLDLVETLSRYTY
jgi:hypothetical protein